MTKGPGEKRALRQNGVWIERKAPKGYLDWIVFQVKPELLLLLTADSYI
jgi:hypothetical protein